jgi:cytochrome c oxidase subunit 2
MGSAPESAAAVSRVASEVDSLFLVIALVGLFFFLLTQGALILFAIRFRRRRQGEETPAITGNLLLETIWIVVPTLVVIAIFFYGFMVYRQIVTPPAESLEIQVTGRQWLYEFTYSTGRKEVNEVRIPVHRPVRFILTSADVIHGFYLPAFRIKQDMVPGRYTQLWLKAETTGTFDIYCSQYCGVGHSTMRATLKVLPADEYEKWLSSGSEAGIPLVTRGKKLMESSGCLACHAVDATVKVGPGLRGVFGHRVPLTDGTTVLADETYIRTSILDPNRQVVKGFPPIMPTYRSILTDEDIAAIIAYLKSLSQQPHPPGESP